ncbi:hypothetical protein diail_11766 [Diaporthe ilicicola]|nr:hypothetical protein diail_11766 [Diaporthe ilicicola]
MSHAKAQTRRGWQERRPITPENMSDLFSREAPLRQNPELRLLRPVFPAEEDMHLPSCAARHCSGTSGKALRLTYYRNSRIGQLEAKIDKLDEILTSQQIVSEGSDASPTSNCEASRSSSTVSGEMGEEPLRIQNANGVSLDPFQLGLLSVETGEILLDRFRKSLTPYFPFVIISDSSKVTDLHREKTLVCLAVLFAASNDDRGLQAHLARLFEQTLATALLQGSIPTLENLQGLLIYIAW